MTKRAILYARVSGDDRKNATSSIAGQLDACRAYCNQRGYTIVGESYEEPDKHTSGADWLPELDALIKRAPSGTYDVLVVREIDRLARNRFKQMSVEIDLEAHGVMVEYVLGQFAHNPEGRLLKGLMSEFAEYEREKTRERTTRGIRRSVDAGNIMMGGGAAPYGYDLVTETDAKTGKVCRSLVINEYESNVVKTIFSLYATQRHSLYMIRDYLDDRDIPKPGKSSAAKKRTTLNAWSIGTLNTILDNETYIGRWFFGKTQKTKDTKTGKNVVKPRPREEWLEIAVPSIVTEEMFAAVQERRQVNKKLLGHQHKHEYVLGGMARCGECGNGVTGKTRTHKNGSYQYYHCNSRHTPSKHDIRCTTPLYRVKPVEAAVWSWIKSLLMEPKTLRRAIDDYQEQQRERVQPQLSMLESTQARLTELEGQKTRLIDAYTKGILSLDELASQKTALDKQIADLGQAVATLRAETEPLYMSPERIETIEAIAAEMSTGAALADNNRQAQRAIYQLLDVQVTFSFDGKQRWADVECTLGKNRVSAEYNAPTGDDPDTILGGHLYFLSKFCWDIK